MGKALKTVGAIIGGAVLVATGVGAIAGLQVTALGIAGVGTMSVGTLNTISAGLMAVGGMLDKPKSEGSGSPTEWTSNPDQPIPFAFGRIGVAGKIVHRDEFGPNDNMYEAVVGILSGAGPINRVVSFAGDRQAVIFDANGKAITSQWSGELWMRYRLGAQPDTAITSPTGLWNNAIVPGWTASHRLSGKAHYLQIMGENSKRSAYPMGEPDPIHVIEGLLLYDPRYDSTFPGGSGTCRYADRSTWRYTENGAIAALNWALGMRENGKLVGGAGLSMAAIDVPAFVEAANVADANGWKVAGWPDSSEDASQVLKQLLEAAGAVYARHAGLVSCVSRGAPRAAIVTITGRDTAGPIELDTGSSMFNRLNTIIPSFMSESHGWKHVPAAPVSFAEYVTADGGRRGDGITYRFVPAVKQAAELAAYDILDAREPFAGTVPLKPHLRRLKRGDCFIISEPGFMMDGVKCLVLGRSFDPKTSEVRITFRSETDSKHPLALGKTTTLPDFPVLEAFDPRVVTPPGPGDWGLSAERFTSDGSAVPALVLLGAVANAKAQSVVFEFRPYGVGAAWASAGEESPDVTRKEIVGLTSGTVYEAAVSYRRANNVSERLVLGPVTAGAAVAEPPYATAPNRVTFSDFQKGTTGFTTLSYSTPTAPTLTRGVTSGLAYLRLSGTATGEQLAVMGSEANYRYPVKAGERLVVRLGLHATGAVYRTDVQIQWFNAAGALISVAPVAQAYGAIAFNAELFGFATAPAGAVTAGLAHYINTSGAGAYTGSMIRPMVSSAFPNQTVAPPYVSGAAAVPGADPTGDNISAGFSGQGALATLNAVDRATITGVDYQNLLPGELKSITEWTLGGSDTSLWSVLVGTPTADAGQQVLNFGATGSPAVTGLAANALYSIAYADFPATADVTYLAALKMRGFPTSKARVNLILQFFDQAGVSLQAKTLATAVLAGATTTVPMSGLDKAPLGTAKARVTFQVRADANGEVNGGIRFRDIGGIKAARLGEGLVREDGTTILTDGTVVTTLGVSAAVIGQTAWATSSEPVTKLSKLKANGRATDSYQVANGVLSGATLYRNPIYVLGSVVNAGAARITIAAHSLTLSGSPVVSYGGGNINGLAFNTKYNVWVYDPDVVGGAVTYVATTSPTTYQTNPDYLLIDTIVTVNSGGGSGTISPPPLPPGGDGTIDPSCVCTDSWLPSLKQARDVEAVDALLMLRDDGAGVESGKVEGVRFAMAHCLRLRTVSGIELDCSTKTPIPYLKGNEVALKWAWECDGSERVAVLDHDGFRFEALAGPPAHIGWKRVAMISADNGVYAAGRQRGRYIFTHNIRWKG